MVLILFGILIAVALWAWFARDLPRTVRVTALVVAAAAVAFLLFAVLLERMN